MANVSGYSVGGGSGGGISVSDADDKEPSKGYWSHAKLKRAYLDYVGNKRDEIDEQQDARRFRHGSHWTQEELSQLDARKQPAVWENITGRKINGIVGTLARLRQDPRAYPRTPKHEQGAELANFALISCLEDTNWDSKDPIAAEMGAVDGVGGIELNLVDTRYGKTPDLAVVRRGSFFYDPRSEELDFSDARYMGVSKLVHIDTAVEMFPDKEDELLESLQSGSELTTDPDNEQRWFSEGDKKHLRLVDLWYRARGEWYWAIFTGVSVISEGKSYLKDEEGHSACKYIMFSASVDHDGDRYGFVRDLKPLNRELNMRRSKALHFALTKRIMTPKGAFDSIEVARREAARADGVIEYNPLGGDKPEFDDASRIADMNAQFSFYENLKTSIESFGPNIAVTGQGLENSSGRAIHLLQQAGLADLGPYIQSYRGWKIRVYRAVWNAIQQYWTGERWIRVTDDEDLTQFIKVNGVEMDPMTGQPTMVNAIGELDVDIILDEGPDTVNQAAAAYDTLTLLASKGAEVPPSILIELAPLPVSVKKKLLEQLNPEPTPEMEKRKEVELQMGIETVREKGASAKLKEAQAYKAIAEANAPPEEGDISIEAGEHPMTIQTEAMEKQAAAAQKMADAEKKQAETQKIYQDIQLEPQRMAMEHQANQQKMQLDAQNAAADRQMQARQAQMSAKQQAKDSDRNYKVNMKKASQKPATPKKAK